MEAISTTTTAITHPTHLSPIHGLMDKWEHILRQHRMDNPDLYRMLQQKKNDANSVDVEHNTQLKRTAVTNNKTYSILNQPLRGTALRARIQESYGDIRQRVIAANADIVPRTQAQNRKSPHTTIEAERSFRSDIVSAQIRAWRSLLPTLIQSLSKIPDPRRTKNVKHKLTVLMAFGLFAFIFRLSSRREMNRDLTGALIHENLQKIFPEIDTIPHADTLARLLEKINPQTIEAAHINLVNELITKKKFRKLLIHGCLPVTVDGTQKLTRDGLLQDARWCERKVGNPGSGHMQQYMYAIEANITLKNGLTIPLMTEYLHRENNQLMQPTGKQDSETTAFERLAGRLKKYFPRLKILFFMDAMYSTQQVMGILHKNNWEYIIRLPKKKLTDFAKRLNKSKSMSMPIPSQMAYRKRKQEFYWQNDINYGYEWQLNIHLAGCSERYEEVDKKTGEIAERFSEHAWISSIRVNIHNVHELFNCGARKKELIEDSINTEKNRGYHYQHAFSYNWNAMQCFHYLMRLGHAINAISEFTKKLKHYIRKLGCSATLKIIKDTLFSPWLSSEWYTQEYLKTPQLHLQLE